MHNLVYHFYNILIIPFLRLVILIGSFTNGKIGQGSRGRKDLFQKLEKAMKQLKHDGPRFWVHSSSMGEFEQTKPIIEKLKERFPEGIVIVSFFSPSVFEHVQGYPGADCLTYIPFDSKRRARRFISLIRPDMAIMVRHDLWPNHLHQLNKQRIPCVLVNCSVRPPSDYRLPLIVHLNRFLYRHFDLILTVSAESKALCQSLKLARNSVEMVGDTRYDQVIRRANEAEKVVAPLRGLKGDRMGFVMGSTWPSDETVLFDALSQLYRRHVKMWCVLVPHEPSEERLIQIEQQLSRMNLSTVRLSEVHSDPRNHGDILLIDRVGILASLYALGELSFVGGGFGPGIHNVLEPAALGKIVFFGPRCRNSYEAGLLERRGVGYVVKDGESLFQHLYSLLNDTDRMIELGQMAAHIVQENSGATQRIIDHLMRWAEPHD